MKRTTATTDLDALKATVSLCEFCFRRSELQPHHVCQGFRFKAYADASLVLMLCNECHDGIHELPGNHGRALGLALLHHAGRGGVEHFYKVTGRRWPDEKLIEAWIRRLTRREL